MSLVITRPRDDAQHREPAEPARSPPKLRRRLRPRPVDLMLPTALILWATSLGIVNPEAINDFGLLAALPGIFFLAVGLLIASTAFVLTRARLSPVRLLLHLVALVLVLHGTVPLIVTAPNYPWVYKHIGVVGYLNKWGRVDTRIDIYQNWPGFFVLGAWFTRIAGLATPLGYAAWAPVYFNLLTCVELGFAARALGVSLRTRWLALFLFVAANWVGQDYFAPQAMAFVLTVGVLGMVLAWLRADRPTALLRTSRRLIRRVAITGDSSGDSDHAAAGLPPPRRRALGLVALLTVFAVVVVTHQLSPYMVIIAVGLLAALGLVRPRWVVAAMVVLAGAYFFLRLPYLSHTQNLFGSMFDPLHNVKGNGVTPSRVQTGRRLTALGAPALLAGMWALAMLGLARRARAGRPVARLVILAASPALLALVQSYGGEAVFRIYLFSLPWTAVLAAYALEPRLGRWELGGAFSVTVVLCVTVGLFMCAFFGAEELYRVRAGEIRASQFFYENADPHSILVLGASHFPSRVAPNYDAFISSDSTPNLLTTPDGHHRPELRATDLPAVARVVAGYSATAPGGAYLALTTDQQTYATVLGLSRSGSLAKLDRALGQSPQWQVFYRTGDAVIYRFLDGRPRREARPHSPIAGAAAAAGRPERTPDATGLAIAVAGFAVLVLALGYRRARSSTHVHTHQEKTMDFTLTTNGADRYNAQPDGDAVPPDADLGSIASEPTHAPWPATDDLTSLLDDSSPAVRVALVERLEPSPANVRILHRLLVDDLAVSVRAEAVRALAGASDVDQRSALAVALADPSALVRATAVEVLAVSATPEIEPLVAACDDPEPDVRRAAHRRLTGAPAAVVWAVLRGSVRAQELRAALRQTAPDRLAEVAAVGLRSPAPGERVLSVELAGEADTPAAVAAIMSALADADAVVRRAAIAQLGGHGEAGDALIGALGDHDPAVRAEAVGALGSLDEDDAVVALISSLDDSDPGVQRRCVEALVARSSPGLARRVGAALTPSNSRAVTEVLVRMGPTGQEVLGARIREDAQVAAASASADLLESARARALQEAASIREAAMVEAEAARKELQALRSAAMEDARRRALEEAARIRREAMDEGDRLRLAVLDDVHRYAAEQAERIRAEARAEAEKLRVQGDQRRLELLGHLGGDSPPGTR